MNIALSTKTYIYLILSGIAVFAAGAVAWNYIGKAIK
jgi:hypothetical protein